MVARRNAPTRSGRADPRWWVRCALGREDPTELRTDRSYGYPFTVPELWQRLGRVDAYRTWWPWLSAFDGAALATGEVWSCTVQPPLPYAVRFRVHFHDVIADERIHTTIDGDIEGMATLELSDASRDGEPGSRLRLVAGLAPRKRSMVALSTIARPLVTFGHHWVLDTGARQFAEGLGGRAL